MRMTESQPEKKIIVIPAKKESPQEQAKKRNLRVAAYCRVSTGDEEQLTSYENQKAFYTEKIMKNPEWTMVDIFADEGITGTSTCRRKDFLRMIRQCRQGKIDMILPNRSPASPEIRWIPSATPVSCGALASP